MVLQEWNRKGNTQIVSELLEDLNFKCDFKTFLSSNCGITIEEAVEEEEGRKAL